ncbi:DUF6489 family protein [Luteithermobacter gelatinilyticus]|uniref:DUF6489 family protein n=1 Tax=Luteithermobacter gelatinilyticus TaxID=2582913 RepID=UPI001105974C|nr:DUF6489 family protein [Luteithermobacter gelatinilyticus]|tara:strand:- start:2970 stop:3230 length:261 start_codon:yes stop_codon:yes gene_type:complete
MKISIDIDCTPKEARQFLGLPDIEPLQQAFLKDMQEKMTKGLAPEDMDKLFSLWLAPSMTLAGQGLETFQNMFWKAAGGDPKKSGS